MAPATNVVAADRVLREANREVLTMVPSEQAGYLLQAIGPRYAAVGLGLSDARQLKAWRDQGTAPREGAVRARLTILAQVVRAIESVYSADTAAAFLYSANPDLDDQPPLLVLADGDPLQVGGELHRAVRAFLEP